MSWASRRRTTYLGGVIIFFAVIIAIPVANYFLSIKPTCFDGRQDGGETAVDEGGPCLKLDPAQLSPLATLWSRAFQVRDGSYTAIAYVENANQNAGIAQVDYEFSLYDANNILIAQQNGMTFIMPDGTTPVFVTGIKTGNRIAVHTYFQITDASPVWDRMTDPASAVTVTNQQVSNATTLPRLTATAQNTSFAPIYNVSFVAVVFDPSGNAIAASGTELPELDPGAPQQITFTWPQAYSGAVGQIDITPLLPPVDAPTGS